MAVLRRGLKIGPLCCFAAFSFFGAAIESEPPISPAERLFSTLAVSPGKSDPMPEIADAIDNPGKDLDSLVGALLTADPDAIRARVFDHTTIEDPASRIQMGAYSWKYGSFDEREGLRQRIWSTAKAEEKVDPVKAKRYAEASILFAAMDDFPMGLGVLRRYLADANGMSLLGLKEPELDKIRGMVKAAGPIEGEDEVRALKALDRLFKHPDEYQQAIDKLTAWHARAVNDGAAACDFAVAAKLLLDHAALTKDQKVVALAEHAVGAWMSGSTGNFKRWMTEAAGKRSVPGRAYALSVMVDGKLRETDTDGNVK